MNHYLILTLGVLVGLGLAVLTLWLYSNAYKPEHEKSHLTDERLNYIRSGGSFGGRPR